MICSPLSQILFKEKWACLDGRRHGFGEDAAGYCCDDLLSHGVAIAGHLSIISQIGMG